MPRTPTSLLIVVTLASAALLGCTGATDRSGGRLVGDDECLPAEDGACREPTDVCAAGDARCPDPLPPMIACAIDADCAEGFRCRFQDGSTDACGGEVEPTPTDPAADGSPAPTDSDPSGDGAPREASDTSREANGLCVRVPDACIEIYDPVCGCDGVTYDNECFATMAGASILHRGECRPEGGECGGALDFDCGPRSFCAYAPDAACGSTGVSGVCRPRPEACPDVWAPVCGCDGVTYSNECDANAAGASVAHDGECRPSGGECGGALDFDCDPRSFCAYAPDAACGSTGVSGVCRPRPEACPDVWDPVCGCDGVTYSNECDANAAGVSVDHRGECRPAGSCRSDADCGDGQVCAECWGSYACIPRGAIC